MNATTTSQDGNKEVTEGTPSGLTSEEGNEQSEIMTTAEITSLLMEEIIEV